MSNDFNDAFIARNAQLAAQQRLARVTQEAAAEHRGMTTKLVEEGRLATDANARADRLRKERDDLKAQMARPMSEVFDELAQTKAALVEARSLSAVWQMRQRAMKKVAIEVGAQAGKSVEDIRAAAIAYSQAIANGSDLDGVITAEQKTYFAHFRGFLKQHADK
ncbi:hypothetical protein [Variovorax sp. LT1R16]|uniref:hypothetical protein n=1 Tax=Variovorax sp. LT1R16 TaxID=3443728 RepID=UPI003F48F0E2